MIGEYMKVVQNKISAMAFLIEKYKRNAEQMT